MKTSKYLTSLTELTSKGPQRFECTKSNGFVAWEID